MRTKHFLYATILILLSSTTLVQAQREIRSLNSGWDFHRVEQPEKVRRVNLPHTWNAEDAFRDGKEYARTTGIYERKLFVPQDWGDRVTYLKFEGSNQVTTVYLNGQKAGSHTGGYTGFVIALHEHLEPGTVNNLRIEVNNEHHADIPPLDADFNFYGGIYRDLWLISLPQVHFELANDAAGRLQVGVTSVSESNGKLQLRQQVVNHGKQRAEVIAEMLLTDPNGRVVSRAQKQLRLKANSDTEVSFEQEVEEPMLWSPDTPQLYRVHLQLRDRETQAVLDEQFANSGFRWFRADPEQGFFLNGKPIKLIGANRHQDFEGLGNALPDEMHLSDYRKIKEMGANFIRTAHYPQDPEVYRICDELGLLVWSEIPVINDVTDSEAYHQNALQMQREQVLQFYNHPSIIMWGYMNEIFIRLVFNRKMTEAEKAAKIKTSVALAEKLEKLTKELDPHRLSVMALHENEIYNTSGIADIPDMVGWNLYQGWYGPGLENFGKFLDEQHRRYPERPLFVSEYGPGADVRNQTDEPSPWDYSEAYQLKLHHSYLEQVRERDFVMGMAAWNFADFGSSFRQDAKPYVNQKGLLNMDRSTKDIYHYYQAMLLEEPVVYLAGKNYTERYLRKEGEEFQFIVFSNQEEVEIASGDKVWRAPVQAGIARFRVALPPGRHELIARAGGREHRRIFTISDLTDLDTYLDTDALRVNLGTRVQYRDPVSGESWIADQEYQAGGFGAVGGADYQPSKDKFQGSPSDVQLTENDPLFQTMKEGIEAYQFDVQAGVYRVTLLFNEPNSGASSELVYNLTSDSPEVTEKVRSFDILINGQNSESDLNLARDYGTKQAVILSYIVHTEAGVRVAFEPHFGQPVLSGIKLERL